MTADPSDLPARPHPNRMPRPPVVASPRRAWQRAIGALLLLGTVGVASCQALFADDRTANAPLTTGQR